MKLHDKQKFEVKGVDWQFRKGQIPQGTLHALTKQGNTIAYIQPKDVSKPIWAENNAVLTTRSGPGNQWTTHPSSQLKQAVQSGTKHANDYERDKQIAAMETALKQPSKAISASNDKGIKPPKLRTLKSLMEWQQKQKAEGKDTNPNTAFVKDDGMGM